MSCQPKAVRWWRFPRRDPRKPITVSIKLRGGAEAWVEVKGRGSVGRYTGHTPILDVVKDINNDW